MRCDYQLSTSSIFSLPSRKFKICWVIFKEGRKIGIISASAGALSESTCCLIQGIGQLGNGGDVELHRGGISQGRAEECHTLK